MHEVCQRLPDELEELTPGPELATLLASVDRDALSGKDRVRLTRARNRLSSHVQAELVADLYAVTEAEPPDEDEGEEDGDRDQLMDAPDYPWTEVELSFALRWTSLAVSRRIDQARQMLDRLPQVHSALAEGHIDMPKALLFLEMLGPLETPVAQRIADRLLERASELTTGQLRARLRRLVIAADPDRAAADPDRAAANAKAEVKQRRVTTMLKDNGLADIAGYDMAPHRIAAGWERLNAIAKAAKAAGDPRRIDELRADAFLDILIGEGAAVGGPITNGGIEDLPQPETTDNGSGSGSTPTTERQMNPVAPDTRTPWPAEPADPSLLDPTADPPMPHRNQTSPETCEPVEP